MTSSAAPNVERLIDATNRHDLDALVDCFAPDFVNETPAHPARSFTGRDQVRRNWSQIFAGVPDLKIRIVRQTTDLDTCWTELEMSGTRLDGAAHLMRGVAIFGVEGGQFGWIRFYVEPVERGGVGIDVAVGQHVGR